MKIIGIYAVYRLFALMVLVALPLPSQALPLLHAWYYFEVQNTGPAATDFHFTAFSDSVGKAVSNDFKTATVTPPSKPTEGGNVDYTNPAIGNSIPKNTWITFGYRTGLLSTGNLLLDKTYWTFENGTTPAVPKSRSKLSWVSNPDGTITATVEVYDESDTPLTYNSWAFSNSVPINQIDISSSLLTGANDFLSSNLGNIVTSGGPGTITKDQPGVFTATFLSSDPLSYYDAFRLLPTDPSAGYQYNAIGMAFQVPEPATIGLLAIGFVALVLSRRRRGPHCI